MELEIMNKLIFAIFFKNLNTRRSRNFCKMLVFLISGARKWFSNVCKNQHLRTELEILQNIMKQIFGVKNGLGVGNFIIWYRRCIKYSDWA